MTDIEEIRKLIEGSTVSDEFKDKCRRFLENQEIVERQRDEWCRRRNEKIEKP